ncbi:glutaredoxin family protein [Halalkalibacter nanhaiisediminis]|uniref:Glutaredoxin-like protein NrdH n=1 Tax=Halalkalibacter nanhaiisediminis TaxID=688079 RepID=A0A562QQV4_9BACI|nr:glutaredoxin family protein [Halalkalibacter nanhaiisediminis]TWI59085.1 glutaredoxin-like protein NrdH [Halalkalibacter nanhaiisediminis]
MNKQVIVYSTQDCIECNMVKQMLTREGIPFEVRDVMTSEVYQQEVEKFGYMGVPVTVVEDQAVKGFVPELENLIELAKK